MMAVDISDVKESVDMKSEDVTQEDDAIQNTVNQEDEDVNVKNKDVIAKDVKMESQDSSIFSNESSDIGEDKETKEKEIDNDDSEDDQWPKPWRSSFSKSEKIVLPRVSRYSTRDTEQYRKCYPGKIDNPNCTSNYKFYMNEIPSSPNGDYIDTIHNAWWGNYELLEYHHSYIQWLFPIRERGLNFRANELQLHEVKLICSNDETFERFIKSYEMMLDFYGLKLKDRDTGEVERSLNWRGRFHNLNRSSHNYLRITRILKCLGEFGLEKYKGPLIRHLLVEAIEKRTLLNTLSSCMNYWINVVRDDKERIGLQIYAKELVDKAN